MREVEAITIMVVGGGAGEDIVWKHLPIILSFEYNLIASEAWVAQGFSWVYLVVCKTSILYNDTTFYN